MIPDDDPSRSLTVANPDDPGTTYIALVGDTYAMLVTGEQTNGRYCLIDMHVPRFGRSRPTRRRGGGAPRARPPTAEGAVRSCRRRRHRCA